MPDHPDERKGKMNKNILYLDGFSGISGDMFVAALLDLGGNREKLEQVLSGLGVHGFHIEISEKKSYGLKGCDFNVVLHEHLHHHHRNLSDITEILERATLSENVRVLAGKIFQIIAEAEAKAHGCSLDQVHFHEVGAVDSIVDIVSAAVLIDDLGIDECVITGLSEGSGTVMCQHGELPVPVPAVVNIATAAEIPLRRSERTGEMITPTGIAIAAGIRTRKELPKTYTIRKTGMGLGKKDFGGPNILRAMLIAEETNPEQIYVLESNIDDSTGERLGFAMEKLFEAGAKDVIFHPCYMKKNRPAVLLKIIAAESALPEIEKTLFRFTTTIGLRKYPVERVCMSREIIPVETSAGTVEVKRCSFGDIVRYYPEFETVRTALENCNSDFQAVYDEAAQLAKEKDV